MKISGIYKIQSLVNPKRIYIGSAVNLKKRFYIHLFRLRRNKHHSIKLQNHYNKYGESDLKYSIILTCKKEELIQKEQFFIDSLNPWFNCSPKAGSTLGIKHTKKARENMSKSHIGYKWTKEAITKRTLTVKNRKCSEETKLRMSKAAKKIIHPPMPEEQKIKISRALKGRKRSSESIRKMIITKKIKNEHISSTSYFR